MELVIIFSVGIGGIFCLIGFLAHLEHKEKIAELNNGDKK